MGVGMNMGIGDNTYSCQYRYNYRCRKGMLQAVLPGEHEVLTACALQNALVQHTTQLSM